MDYLKNYEKWKKALNLIPEFRQALNQLDQSQIYDAFHKNLEFKTAGVRGIMGVGTNRFNIYTVKKMVLGYAKYIKKYATTTNYSVAISYDNRNNSKEFAFSAARVFASEKIKVFITKTLRPSPFLSFMVRHFQTSGGMMITASHNPKEYSGIKVYNNKGGQLSAFQTNLLIKEIEQIQEYFNIQEYKNDDLIHLVDEDLDCAYLSNVKKISLTNYKEKPLKFIYSSLHGTGATLVLKLLHDLGYNVIANEKEIIPDGNFSHIKSANPEDLISFDASLRLAKKNNADLVLLTDPDADRLGVMVKNKNRYIKLNGNQTALLLLYYILSIRQKNNSLPQKGVVYASNVTTPLIEKMTESFNLSFKVVLPGFKNVAEQMELSMLKFIFAAEESYGFLISDFVRDKDAIQAVLLLCEMATYYHYQNQTLYDVLLQIYKRFGFYAEKTVFLSFDETKGEEKIKNIMDYFRQEGLNVFDSKLFIEEDYLKQTSTKSGVTAPINLAKANILKYTYNTYDIIILRPSGTEPKLKIYFYIKDESLSKANQKLTKIETLLLKKIKDVEK